MQKVALQRIKMFLVIGLVLILISGVILIIKNNLSHNVSKQINTQPAIQNIANKLLNVPTSIQSVSISDDSPAGIYWIPTNEKIVLSQVVSWLKTAVPYEEEVPQSEKIIFHANIGPSILYITGPDENNVIMIYPAWYTKRDGEKTDAYSVTHYVENVVAVKLENKVTYLKCEPLYNWLKTDEWKKEFVR